MEKSKIQRIINDIMKCTSSQCRMTLVRDANMLTVYGEGHDVVMSGKIECPGDDFTIGVNGTLLDALLGKIYGADVSLFVKDEYLHIQAEGVCVKLQGITKTSVKMFPDDMYKDVNISVADIRQMVPEVVHVINPGAGDMKLRSVCIETDKTGTKVAVKAVSNVCVAVRKNSDFEDELSSQFIVESKQIANALSVISDNGVMKYSDTVQCRKQEIILSSTTNKGLRFCDDTYTIDVPLIDGEFYNTSRLLKQRCNMSTVVNRRALIAAIEINSLMDSHISLDIDKNQMIISAASAKGGSRTKLLANTSGKLSKMSFKVKAEYLLGALKNLKETEVTFKLCTNTSPLLFSSCEGETELLCPCAPV